MRYLSTKPALFIIVILSAALYLQRTKFTADASSIPPPLTGAAVVGYLKEQGLYSSLVEAARAARHNARPLPAHFEQAVGVEDRKAESSPEASLAINLPFVRLFRQTAHDGMANDNYGRSVAASDDTVVVGAYLDTVGNNDLQGSAYVFSRSGGDWRLQQKLTAHDGEAQDRFGNSVAISGDTIVVGAPYHKTGTNSYQGSAYVFARSSGVWSIQQKLTAQDGAEGDQFGTAVAISGDTVVAGAFSDDIGAKADQGSAYVFSRSGSDWTFQQKLTANDGEANDQFGASVAISDGTVIAGALLDDFSIFQNAGSAYVFVRSGTAWTQLQRLVANGTRSDDLFGAAVAILGDTAIIGAPLADPFGRVNQGVAFVFVRSGGIWSYQADLLVNDGEAEDRFGSSVALNGDTALVGAHFDDIGTTLDQGSAYLFTRSGTLWAPRQKFTARDGAARELFGYAVALSGERAIVGAPHARIGANAAQGAVYLFGCGYVEQQKLTGLDIKALDNFGHAMAIDGDTAVVGVPFYDVGPAKLAGAAYVFVREGAGWTQSEQLIAGDGGAEDRFGYSVAISGNTIVIGAPFKTFQGNAAQGAAYVFARSGGAWGLQGRLLSEARNALFGYSVSISDNLVAVGSPYHKVGENQDQGSVTIFTRSGTMWSREKVLTANDGAASDNFGWSVALSGERVLVGAPSPVFGGRTGAAYVFERSSTQSLPWEQRAKLIANDAQTSDLLGYSVALYGNTALVGAQGKVINDPLRRQAAYIFVTSGTPGEAWSQQERLVVGEGEPTSLSSVALSGDTAVVGTKGEIIEGRLYQGAARVFTRSGTVWSLQQQIVASDGQADDQFGVSVAIFGDTIMAGASGGGNFNQGAVYVLTTDCGPPLQPIASVSAASFASGGGLAPESITAGFGPSLGDDILAASSTPLPTRLGGLSVIVRDSAGVEQLAPLFFVSPRQINYQVPPGTATGPVSVTITSGAGPVASGTAQISNVAPGLFSANSSGQGVAAALALRIKADGSQSFEPVARFDAAQNRFVPEPIDLGPDTDRVFLLLYGTGIKFRTSLSTVSCTIGGTASEVLFAGAVPEFVGLDQVNVHVPRSLAGRGEVDVVLSVDGEAANTVRVSIR